MLAFRFVELPVVIAIVTVQFALMPPSREEARDNARLTQYLGKERKVTLAHQLFYANDSLRFAPYLNMKSGTLNISGVLATWPTEQMKTSQCQSMYGFTTMWTNQSHGLRWRGDVVEAGDAGAVVAVVRFEDLIIEYVVAIRRLELGTEGRVPERAHRSGEHDDRGVAVEAIRGGLRRRRGLALGFVRASAK